ncbi:MAG TPA: 5'-3' exonuclease [Actinomycetota bacterium]|nr:5'-3' exonuclease [Actinomycetota bacterium]
MTQLLLDTSSLMYRAYFALPRTITNKDGQPVNALHGYLDMCAQLVRDRMPKSIVHCFDHDWRPAPRVAAYNGYKATRAVDPEGLPEQFEVLQDLIDATGMARAEAKGWEAEDAIGSLCAKNTDIVEIVTGDRDLIQCVRDPNVKVLFTRRGVSQLDLLDEAGVEAKYGVPPSRYADFAILRGDPSDELPGIKGVGEVMARALVRTYPSLEALQQDALAPRSQAGPLRSAAGLKAKIRDAADYLAAMQEVVPIQTDLDVELIQGKGDEERLDQLAEQYALTGPVRRLREAFAAARAPSPTPPEARRRPAGSPRGTRR